MKPGSLLPLLLLPLAAGCPTRTDPGEPASGAPVPLAVDSLESATMHRPATPAGAPAPPANNAEMLLAPQDGRTVAARVLEARAELPDRRLVVYVGATWCDPCQRFHDAVAAGRLNDELPGTTFLEFDHDVDAHRLEADGYTSRLIPLFVLPGPDGRATDRKTSGGIKGQGAVDNLLPRVQALLR